MLGLPKATELSKQLPKTAIYSKFQMNTAAKEKIDADISRITIVNEITSSRVNIDNGESVQAIYILLVLLKHKEFNEKNIVTISKLIPQNMIMVLECDGEQKLAIYHTKLLQSEWKPKDSFNINISGLNLDKVWENIIVQVGGIEIEQGNTLDEQIVSDEQKLKIQKEIEKLEKQARKETQPKKKFELVKQANSLKKSLEEK